MIVETIDIRHVDEALLPKLLKLTFGQDGWMAHVVKDLRRAYRLSWRNGSMTRQPLNYGQGKVFVAKEGDKILGWALVRTPKKVKKQRTYGINGRWVSAGRRPDFMIYVRASQRGKKVAKALLFTAYNSCGKLDVYPHDMPSKNFYNKYPKMVNKIDAKNLYSTEYQLREI